MRLLYVGDVMGEMGIAVLQQVLPEVRSTEGIDIVIAQAENVTDGKGMSIADFGRLKACGVDAFTGGNHSLRQPEIAALLADSNVPVTAPANMVEFPGPGFKYVGEDDKRVLVISLLGHIVGRDSEKPTDNPLQKIDAILETQIHEPRAATVVNFHGDFSSEKVVIGHYLDGKVTAVVGDHWHVPTADARVLPSGTAHMTDVGMCGALNSSLGVTYDSIIPRWRDDQQTKNMMEMTGPKQFNALLVEVGGGGLAVHAKHVQQIIE